METVGSPLAFAGFTLFVLAMLALDLGVFHRKAHAVSVKEAAAWSAVWVALALVFGGLVRHWFGPERGLEYITGYLIEKSLAVDNIFVIVVLFSSFAIPSALQHRVLFWGILGALVMRAAFIFAGAALLARFHWVMYLFGVLLVLTGVKLFLQREVEPHPERNPLYRLFARLIPSTSSLEGARFFVRKDGRLLATPLFLVLVAVEITDLIFAVDSIPAIFAVTTDPFIVYTSNVFAILGLRSMYFLLAGFVDRLAYLKLGLAAILCFVGLKMLLVGVVKIPVLASLAVIALILATSVVASLLRTSREARSAKDA
jgi:tellurite resistance protein TerC